MEESIEVLDSIGDDCKKPSHGRSSEQMILSNPADLNQSSRLWGKHHGETSTEADNSNPQQHATGLVASLSDEYRTPADLYQSSRLSGAEIVHKHHPEPAEKATIRTLNTIYGIPLRLQCLSQSFT
jgi:hypothetical protein